MSIAWLVAAAFGAAAVVLTVVAVLGAARDVALAVIAAFTATLGAFSTDVVAFRAKARAFLTRVGVAGATAVPALRAAIFVLVAGDFAQASPVTAAMAISKVGDLHNAGFAVAADINSTRAEFIPLAFARSSTSFLLAGEAAGAAAGRGRRTLFLGGAWAGGSVFVVGSTSSSPVGEATGAAVGRDCSALSWVGV